ncbi:MAG: aldehyde-activating protein [Pseudomonadota bacterium]
MTGTCHCGAVSVTVAHKPEYVNFCDCTLCAKTGGVWGYYQSAEVTVMGQTRSYHRVDREIPACEMHSCPKCSTTTHWHLTKHFEGDRVGVNMRIFEPAEVAGIEARFLDGRNWTGETEPRHRRPIGKLGVDAFL